MRRARADGQAGGAADPLARLAHLTPEAQLDTTTEIKSTEDGGYDNQPTFRKDGY